MILLKSVYRRTWTHERHSKESRLWTFHWHEGKLGFLGAPLVVKEREGIKVGRT